MTAPKLRFKSFHHQYQECELATLGEIQRGRFTPRPRNDPKYFIGGNIPFVQTGDIVNAPLYVEKYTQFLNEEGLAVSKQFPACTVFITIAANIGDTAIAKEPVACTDSVVAIKTYSNKADPFWLKYFLDTRKSELDSKATHNAQKNINLQVLRPLKVAVPAIEEQQKVGLFLSKIDQKISSLIKKHELLMQYKNSIMQQIFNQEIRFKDEDGQEFSEWQDFSLGEVGEIVTGKTPKTGDKGLWGGELLFVTPTDMTVSKFQYESARTVTKTPKLKILPKNSIMFTCIASIGKMALSAKECITNQQINSIIPHEQFDSEYIYYALLNVVDYIKSTKSSSALPIINKTEFSKFIIGIPSVGEQQVIAKFISNIDRKIELIQSQITLTKQYKQGLLQQMFI